MPTLSEVRQLQAEMRPAALKKSGTSTARTSAASSSGSSSKYNIVTIEEPLKTTPKKDPNMWSEEVRKALRARGTNVEADHVKYGQFLGHAKVTDYRGTMRAALEGESKARDRLERLQRSREHKNPAGLGGRCSVMDPLVHAVLQSARVRLSTIQERRLKPGFPKPTPQLYKYDLPDFAALSRKSRQEYS